MANKSIQVLTDTVNTAASALDSAKNNLKAEQEKQARLFCNTMSLIQKNPSSRSAFASDGKGQPNMRHKLWINEELATMLEIEHPYRLSGRPSISPYHIIKAPGLAVAYRYGGAPNFKKGELKDLETLFKKLEKSHYARCLDHLITKLEEHHRDL